MSAVEVEGGNQLVGEPLTASEYDAREYEDKECRCGGCRSEEGWFMVCLCCCRVKLNRLIEIFLLGCVFLNIVLAYQPLLPSGLLARNANSGILWTLVSFVYVPLMAFGANRGVEYCKCGRFRVGMFLAVAIAWVLLILPILLNISEARGLEHSLQDAIGKSNSPDPQGSSFHFFRWMLSSRQVWGPYGDNTAGKYKETKETYTFMTGLVERKVPDIDGRKIVCDSPTARAFSGNLELDVYRPEKPYKVPGGADAKSPIVFFVHGGAWVSNDKDTISWSIAYLLERGYAVVSPQYMYTCWGYSWLEMNEQIHTAFNYMRANATKWGFDENRIFVMGESAGGHLALMFSYTFDTHTTLPCSTWKGCGIRAVYDLYGAKGSPNCGLFEKLLTNKTCVDSPEHVDMIRPVKNVKNATLTPPTVTIHGTWDLLVRYPTSVEMHDELEKAGVKHHLITLRTYPHVLEYGYYGLPGQMNRYAMERVLAAEGL